MATTVTKTVISGGGGDYPSFDAWEDDFGTCTQANYGAMSADGDLVDADLIAQALCTSGDESNDTTTAIIDGWDSTDATRYIEVKGGDFPDDGIFDGTKYLLYNNDVAGTGVLTCIENNVRLTNIQVSMTGEGGGDRAGVSFNAGGAGDSRIDSCIFTADDTGVTGTFYGLRVNSAGTLTVVNTLFIRFDESGSSRAVRIDGGTVDFYGDNWYDCGDAIRRIGGTVSAKGCTIALCDDDINGTVTLTYSCTEDDQAGTNFGPSGGDWDNEFTNAAGNDFSLKVDAACIDSGDGTEAKAFTTVDIVDTTRGPADADWCVGAFEFVAAPPGTILTQITNAYMKVSA